MTDDTGQRADGPTGQQGGPAGQQGGHLIAFEGLDQSGKQTQAQRLVEAFRSAGHKAEFLTFPEYTTAIGTEIGHALQGERDYQPDTLQLLYIARSFRVQAPNRVVARVGDDGDLQSIPGFEHRLR